ncbi:MAG: nickel pincer cofactor biosynthesis protein LarC [Candidatus Hydrogenedentes bacterium]|nr:nickel pincer cofactor biosynthesis protein LarC [Candidatus Hydrogenedentota bacterium]
MKTLYLDCFCGISGDMTVGALIDAGAPIENIIAAVQSMSLTGVSVSAAQVSKKGIKATQFDVSVNPDVHQPHRHLPNIIKIIEEASLPVKVKEESILTFQLLGKAEAQVHGTSIEKVHFHEVGAADSIVDIVAANLALYDLGIERTISSPLITGSGTIRCDHGIMPVPAPATALLLCDIPWQAGDIEAELATPTGVALAKHWAKKFASMPLMKTESIGYGAGKRDLSDRANVLRVFIGESTSPMPALESISILETIIDDMNPELTALLITETMQAGAKDSFITPIIAKKGRSAHCLTVLCDHEKKENILNAIFKNSTTLGIRIHEEKRYILNRKIKKVATTWGKIPIKVGILNNDDNSIAPEFDYCHEAAEKHGIATRKIYEAAMAAAIKGEFLDE